MMHYNNVVVVGYGSIGKKHVNFLENKCNRILVVDSKFSNLIEDSTKAFSEFKSVNEIKVDFTENDVAIISNWGPDHFVTIQEIVSKGVKNIVLEKPCVDSLQEIDLLRELALTNQLKISVNQGWFYENLAAKINQLSIKMNLGKVVAIWVTGGARCLSTAGSHWISLVNQIYGSEPIILTSDAKNHFINPRSKKLAYIEGVFSLYYSENRRLGINLSNFSSIEGRFEIYWRDAVGELNSNKIKIFSREKSSISEKITRYGQAPELIFEEDLGDIQNSLRCLHNSFDEYNIEKFSSTLEHHLNTTKCIILSLIASEQKRQILFKESISEEFYIKKYGIS